MSIIGALVDGVAWTVGGTVTAPLVASRWRRRLGRDAGLAGPSKPICGCKHHLAQHDPRTGVCHSWLIKPGMDALGGLQYGSRGTRCTCRQYVGPRPPELVVLAESLGYTDPDLVALLPSEQRSDKSREN